MLLKLRGLKKKKIEAVSGLKSKKQEWSSMWKESWGMLRERRENYSAENVILALISKEPEGERLLSSAQ